MLSLFFKILLVINITFGFSQNNQVLWTAAWSNNGKYIAVGGNQGNLKIYNAETFQLLQTFPVEGVILSRLKWHPYKNKLAVITQSDSFKAKILSFDDRNWVELKNLDSSFRGLDWNYDGSLLAVSEPEEYVSIYTDYGELVSRFKTDPKGAAGLDWHPKKNILVTVGSQIGIYTHLGDTLKTFKARQEESLLLCIEWHRSGKFFAVGDYGDLEKAENKLVQFWDIRGEKLNELKGSIAEYRNIRWNRKGNRLATASETLRIWTKKGKLLAESKSSEDYLWGIDWSPNGKYILTTSSKGLIVVWDKKANKIKELEY